MKERAIQYAMRVCVCVCARGRPARAMKAVVGPFVDGEHFRSNITSLLLGFLIGVLVYIHQQQQAVVKQKKQSRE